MSRATSRNVPKRFGRLRDAAKWSRSVSEGLRDAAKWSRSVSEGLRDVEKVSEVFRELLAAPFFLGRSLAGIGRICFIFATDV